MDLRLAEETYQRMLHLGIPYSVTMPVKGPRMMIKVVAFDPNSNKLGSRQVQLK